MTLVNEAVFQPLAYRVGRKTAASGNSHSWATRAPRKGNLRLSRAAVRERIRQAAGASMKGRTASSNLAT